MKKLYFLLVCLMGMYTLGFAQPCTPDSTLNYNGISPDGLPPAMAGYYYHTVLSFKIPADSVVKQGTLTVNVTVDSAQFIGSQGKPDSFSFVCDKPNCLWMGGSKGCALFSGEVSRFHNDTTLEYPMKIYTKTWFHLTGTTTPQSRIDSATNYVFRILKYNGIGEITTYTNLKAYPNPTQGLVMIELRDLQDDVNEVAIMDAFGKLVYSKKLDKPSSFLTTFNADLSGYTPGLYIVTLTSGNKVGTSKIMLR